MSSIDLTSGRENQKKRTRRALLDAAADLMAAGSEPALEAVAERAGVSRATAYRYFASAEALALEATLDATLDLQPLADDAPGDPCDRAVRIQRRIFDHARDHESQLRLFLASALRLQVDLGLDAEVRTGRRVPLIEQALAPVRERLGEARHRRLVHALAAMTGIEALVVTRDVCDADPEVGGNALAWATKVLVEGAFREAEEEAEGSG